MLDYIFFDNTLCDKFIAHLSRINVAFNQETDDGFGTVQGAIISISEDTSQTYLDDLQQLYDTLQNEQEKLLEASDDALITNVAGMEVVLNNGRTCTIKVDSTTVSQMLTTISFEQLQNFVNDVAKCVQNPNNKPACVKS